MLVKPGADSASVWGLFKRKLDGWQPGWVGAGRQSSAVLAVMDGFALFPHSAARGEGGRAPQGPRRRRGLFSNFFSPYSSQCLSPVRRLQPLLEPSLLFAMLLSKALVVSFLYILNSEF